MQYFTIDSRTVSRARPAVTQARVSRPTQAQLPPSKPKTPEAGGQGMDLDMDAGIDDNDFERF